MTDTQLPVRRSLLPDFDELFAHFPSFANLRTTIEPKVMRLEDEMSDGYYVVSAEIPGVEPDKYVEVTVRDGLLTITAER